MDQCLFSLSGNVYFQGKLNTLRVVDEDNRQRGVFSLRLVAVVITFRRVK
jgi:hypothetical protein